MDDLRLARLLERTVEHYPPTSLDDPIKLRKLKAMLDYLKAHAGQTDQRISDLEQAVADRIPQAPVISPLVELSVSPVENASEEKASERVSLEDSPKPALITPIVSGPQTPSLNPARRSKSPQIHGSDRQTEELVRMAQVIRQNVEGVQQIIRRDRQVLESTAGLMEVNQLQLGKESNRLRRFNQETWITWWRLLLIVVAVLVLFMVMFMFINFTRK